MVVGNQDSLHVAIPGCPDQLTVVGGRIDDDTLIGLGADKELGIVVIGSALHLVYIDLLVFVVCSHRVPPLAARWLRCGRKGTHPVAEYGVSPE